MKVLIEIEDDVAKEILGSVDNDGYKNTAEFFKTAIKNQLDADNIQKLQEKITVNKKNGQELVDSILGKDDSQDSQTKKGKPREKMIQ